MIEESFGDSLFVSRRIAPPLQPWPPRLADAGRVHSYGRIVLRRLAASFFYGLVVLMIAVSFGDGLLV